MYILCVAPNVKLRQEGIDLAEEKGWKVLLVGDDQGAEGKPGFLVKADISDEDRRKVLLAFDAIGLEVDPLIEER